MSLQTDAGNLWKCSDGEMNGSIWKPEEVPASVVDHRTSVPVTHGTQMLLNSQSRIVPRMDTVRSSKDEKASTNTECLMASHVWAGAWYLRLMMCAIDGTLPTEIAIIEPQVPGFTGNQSCRCGMLTYLLPNLLNLELLRVKRIPADPMHRVAINNHRITKAEMSKRHFITEA